MDVKSGIKTTELYITIAIVLLGVLLQEGFLGQVGAPEWVGTLAGALLQAAAVLGYGVSRGLAKRQAAGGAP